MRLIDTFLQIYQSYVLYCFFVYHFVIYWITFGVYMYVYDLKLCACVRACVCVRVCVCIIIIYCYCIYNFFACAGTHRDLFLSDLHSPSTCWVSPRSGPSCGSGACSVRWKACVCEDTRPRSRWSPRPCAGRRGSSQGAWPAPLAGRKQRHSPASGSSVLRWRPPPRPPPASTEGPWGGLGSERDVLADGKYRAVEGL